MKKYVNPNALIIKLTANDVLNGSWNLEDGESDGLASKDMQININGLGW